MLTKDFLQKKVFSKLDFTKIISLLTERTYINVKYLSGSSISFFIKYIFDKFDSHFLVLLPNNDSIDDLYHDLSFLIDENSISVIKEPKYSFKVKAEQYNSLDWIIEGLTKNIYKPKSVIMINESLLDTQLPSPKGVIENYIKIDAESELNYDDFVKGLMLNGFERRDYVASQGEIAIRGGIVDVFPIGWDNPIRFDFWGDFVESIREFDTVSQRSIIEHNSVEFIASLFNEAGSSMLFDFLKQGTIVINNNANLNFESEILEKLNQYRRININTFDKEDVKYNTILQVSYGSVVNLLIELNEYYNKGYFIFLAADGDIHLNRLKEIVEKAANDLKSKHDFSDLDLDTVLNSIHWVDSSISNGFVWHDLNLIYFTEHQIFNRARIRETKKNKNSKALTLRELQDLRIGDFIVHEDKGIGLFDGFKTVELGGNKQDCVKLKFADEDVLYVNLNYINKISKYAAQEGAMPTLSRLGSTEWIRKKARTKSRLKDIARDLIKLYAKRKTAKGFSFIKDDIWQKEFEASFIYEDTPDQARATLEVKNDMESTSPMDRLVCGDVGFGKTEVAIRAAFKAVQSGKQVAVLVPTTILAQQHYMSFKDRFAKYPVKIDVMSRFRTKPQQEEIIKELKTSRLDILIGTHRILSKDIQFNDLGLLVIDEEHRFGVSAKEKLRQYKENIDTLTLTATPIPRTLNFSLMGARDLSIMETPPRNRLPVITEIIEWDDEQIAAAIDKEIKRGGQVFFVSDKIDDLDKIALNLQNLLPDYRIATAHGQIAPTTLEKIMEKFIEGKFEILCATKIIESGIDIPNANTIIINRAQNFGLAELYQLRGRVGRTNKQAFCYLIIPSAYKINQKALRRLQAIEEFTELGSGFQLSLRDLEIRGAGNLLGAEQSGFIIDIGFELFQKILDEAVYELKTEEFSDVFEINKEDQKPKLRNDELAIELDRDALFPEKYIANDTERFNLYKKLYKVDNFKELQDIVKEITDRFGKLPKETENLIFAVKIRIAALPTGFTKITLKGNTLTCDFPSPDNDYYFDNIFPVVADYIGNFENCRLVQNHSKLLLETELDSDEQAIEILWKINKTIELI